DIGAGLIFFPSILPLPPCDVQPYELLTVPIAPLPGNAFNLTNSMPADVATCPVVTMPLPPSCGTPTYSSLKGTLMAATAYQDAHPTHKVNLVLATDAADIDDYCAVVHSIDAVAGLAKSAFDYNGVHTYTVAMEGASIANLNKIAAAGGTTAA